MNIQKKVLIIEDEAPLRNILMEVFEASGYSVFGAADGLEGYTLTLSESPDVVILDRFMPHLDGRGYLQKMQRAFENNTHTKKPYILIFSNNEGTDEEKSIERSLGVDAFFMKASTSLREVVAAVEEIMPVVT